MTARAPGHGPGRGCVRPHRGRGLGDRRHRRSVDQQRLDHGAVRRPGVQVRCASTRAPARGWPSPASPRRRPTSSARSPSTRRQPAAASMPRSTDAGWPGWATTGPRCTYTSNGAVGLSLQRANAANAETVLVAETVVPGITMAAGQQLFMQGPGHRDLADNGPRADLEGGDGRAHDVAEDGDRLDGRVPGRRAASGLYFYLSSTATNAPITASVDDLRAVPSRGRAPPRQRSTVPSGPRAPAACLRRTRRRSAGRPPRPARRRGSGSSHCADVGADVPQTEPLEDRTGADVHGHRLGPDPVQPARCRSRASSRRVAPSVASPRPQAARRSR